uniref:ATP-dependent DNA helicase n=1 Tax=Sipha flava TaxID=143950 RepID=A0A2S2QTF6_9HEMI
MLPHNLQLKVRYPIILLRNFNPPQLYNDTQLIVKKLMKKCCRSHHFEWQVLGENIFLLRIPIIPTDVPIEFKRFQFPISLAFTIRINKFQGQTMSVCVIYLSKPCFVHRILYVAYSWMSKPSSLFVLAVDSEHLIVPQD